MINMNEAAEMDEAVSHGHYAKKQLLCKDWLISWSHRSRFRMGLELARRYRGDRVLDYGCGDGTFLAMLMSEPTRPREAVGVEAHTSLVNDCRDRLRNHERLRFVLADEIDTPEHRGAYDLIFCMEVLEHVVNLDAVIRRIDYLLGESGKLIVSVPVETGLPLLVKQTARRAAGWRGLGDYSYTSGYTFKEYCASMLAGARQHIPRPVYGGEGGLPYHDHKGFNWRLLLRRLADRFEIESTLSSPLAWLPPQLASQVWFVARKNGRENKRTRT